MNRQQAPFRCIGIVGRLFGHSFSYDRAPDTWIQPTTKQAHCRRCGMPKGGWQREQ